MRLEKVEPKLFPLFLIKFPCCLNQHPNAGRGSIHNYWPWLFELDTAPKIYPTWERAQNVGVTSVSYFFDQGCSHGKDSDDGALIFMGYDDVRALIADLATIRNGSRVGILLHSPDNCDTQLSWLHPFFFDALNWLSIVDGRFEGKNSAMASKVYQLAFVMSFYGAPRFFTEHRGISSLTPWIQMPIPPLIFSPSLAFDTATGPPNAQRRFLCNFIGQNYTFQVARTKVFRYLEGNPQWNCISRDRYSMNGEDKVEVFKHAISNSDFTLCPAGYNIESYRIYEAISQGSVPILVRDVDPSDETRDNYLCEFSYPYLKEFSAPFIWLDNWDQLPSAMDALLMESPEQIYQRRFEQLDFESTAHVLSHSRRDVVAWSHRFRKAMRDRMVQCMQLLR